MPKMYPVRVVGFVAAFCLSVALGNLIAGFVCPNPATAIAPSIRAARAPSIEASMAPSDSAFELLPPAMSVVPVPRPGDVPSPAKDVKPARAAPPPQALSPTQRRAPSRYASRDAGDGE
jgi:hypothetical protein